MQINANETLLTSNEANAVFGDAIAFNGDYSVTALYRAIVLNNEPHDDAVKLSEMCSIVKVCTQSRGDVEYAMSGRYSSGKYHLCVSEYSGSWDQLADGFVGWDNLNSPPYYIDSYLSQVTRTKVFVNRATKSVFVAVKDDITRKWAQAFCSMLFGVLPWYFPEPLPDEDADFFRTISLQNRTVPAGEVKQRLIEYVNAAAKSFDVRTIGIQKMISGIADRARIDSIINQRQRVESIQRDIRQLMENLASKYDRLETVQVDLAALEAMPPTDDKDVREFFLSHQSVRLERRDGGSLYYHVIDTLEFYDEDEVRRQFDRKTSWVYDRYNQNDIDHFRALLVEKRGIIRVQGDFVLSNLKLVQPRSHQDYEEGCMPNPHIYFHACSGGNDKYYSQYANEGNWELGVEQSIAAAKNWSVGDLIVSREMMDWLKGNRNDVACIYVTDGSKLESVTPQCRLVTFSEFSRLVDEKKKAEQAESEAAQNG